MTKIDAIFSQANSTLHNIPIHAQPMFQVGIDLCNLPEDDEGYKCMVVLVDYFTKFVIARAIKNKEAVTVATFLYEEVYTKYGNPSIQINDQGREFVAEVSHRLHKLTGTEQRVTSAYHPQASFFLIQTSLVKLLSADYQKEWRKVLSGVIFAFNSAQYASTK